MKKYLFTTFLMLCVCSIKTYAQTTIFASKATGSWGTVTVWENYPVGTDISAQAIGSGTAATAAPSGSTNVYIRPGHIITMGANQACHTLTVTSTAKLINGSGTTGYRLYVANGGGSAPYPINTTITNNGTIGGTGTDGQLYIEPGMNAREVTFTGTGTYNINRLRIQGGKNHYVGLFIDQNMTLNVNSGATVDLYGLSAIHNPTATDDYAITINSGKTVTISGSNAFFNNNPAGAGWGTYTYTINGTLDLTANTVNATSLSPGGGVMNLNVNGTIKTGTGFITSAGAGSVNLKINNGGLVDATLVTTFTALNTKPYVLTGTGALRRTVPTSTATAFPIATSASTYNPVILTNTGTSRVFTVNNLVSTLTSPPSYAYVNKSWNINPETAVTGPVTVSLGWIAADEGTLSVGTNPSVIRNNGTSWVAGTAGTRAGAGTQASPYTITGSYSSFGSFGVGNSAITPPVGSVFTSEPTFHSCSIYYPSITTASDSCKINYRKAGQSTWLNGFKLVYDATGQEYRGSLVHLDENSTYDVSLIPYKNGLPLSAITVANAFKTWTSSPTIASTQNISTYINANGAAVISNVSGSATGWIKITASAPVNASYLAANNATITLNNCHYVILEDITVTGGYKHGIEIPNTSDNIRIINCDISNFGRIPAYQGISGVFYDVNNNNIDHDAGIHMRNPKNVVVERCYIHDPKGLTNPWWGIMELPSQSGQTTGWVGVQTYDTTHPEGTNAIYVHQALGGVVLRYNDFVGSQTHRFNDPIESSENGYVDGGFNKDADIYGNMMGFGQDDGIELDGGQCNIRLYDNRFEQTMTGISIAPNMKGPSYIFNNLIYNLGNKYALGTSGSKNGGGTTYSKGVQHFFNNTILSPYSPFDAVGYGSDANRSAFKAITRNNIFAVTNLPSGLQPFMGYEPALYDQYPLVQSSFDYDLLGNSSGDLGEGTATVAAGNELNKVVGFPVFTNINNGVFTLNSATNAAVDKGTVIANFTKTYAGSKPDIGAFEYGSSSLSPARPIDISADKYYVMMKPSQSVTVTIAIGAIGTGNSFSIKKAADMGWLTVTSSPAAGAISANSTITLTLNAVEVANATQKGMIFMRLSNGFSIPIAIGFTGNGTALGADRTRLSNLTANTGTLVPAFSSEINNYTISVPNSVYELTLSPTVSLSNSTITVNGLTVPSGGTRGFDLVAGRKVYAYVRVTRTDSTVFGGKSTKDYSVVIYRGLPGETIAAVNDQDRLFDVKVSDKVKEASIDQSVNIYPNPADKEMSVSFKAGEFTKVELINSQGRTYGTHKINAQQSNVNISLQGIPAGIYLVKLVSANNKSIVKKLIKL